MMIRTRATTHDTALKIHTLKVINYSQVTIY